jgi:peptidoglycan/LPS O-acetylase OafA/YrhL
VFLTAGDAGIVSAALGHPILLWLGERSYSIYLWHYPMSVFFNRRLIYGHAQANGQYSLSRQITSCVLQIIFTAIVADLCYRFYECPARDFVRRRGERVRPA